MQHFFQADISCSSKGNIKMAILVLVPCHCYVPRGLGLSFASRSAHCPSVAGWPSTALPSLTSNPLCPSGTLKWNSLQLLSVPLHWLKVLSDICKMKEVENVKWHQPAWQMSITKGRENIPLVVLAKLKRGNFKQRYNPWNPTGQKKPWDTLKHTLKWFN